MAKEFRFKGKTLAELHAMSVEEFAALCNSRAKRSLKRTGENKHLLKKIANAKEQHKAGKSPKPIKTHLRDTVITPTMIGILFSVYRGNDFVVVEIKPEMLGHYFGEMALTRKRLLHGKAGIGATKSSTAITAR
jgi:small subunit ribosomal protein S19